MPRIGAILLGLVAVTGVVLLLALGAGGPAANPESASASGAGQGQANVEPLKLGLVPERDIFAQRRRFQALARELADHLGRPVKLVTAASYQAVLDDLGSGEVDVAVLGSFTAALSVDRLGARALLKTQRIDGSSTYRGVIFVREDSPVRRVEDLAGRSIALVRTTTAGNLFPMHEMSRLGLLNMGDEPRIVWLGTHDDVVSAVCRGQVDAGAAKDTRLDLQEAAGCGMAIRRIATGPPAPEGVIVFRKGLAPDVTERIRQRLLALADDPRGREILAAFGARRFLVCPPEEFGAIRAMVEALGGDWERTGITGPSPGRGGLAVPASAPAPVSGGVSAPGSGPVPATAPAGVAASAAEPGRR